MRVPLLLNHIGPRASLWCYLHSGPSGTSLSVTESSCHFLITVWPGLLIPTWPFLSWGFADFQPPPKKRVPNCFCFRIAAKVTAVSVPTTGSEMGRVQDLAGSTRVGPHFTSYFPSTIKEIFPGLRQENLPCFRNNMLL